MDSGGEDFAADVDITEEIVIDVLINEFDLHPGVFIQPTRELQSDFPVGAVGISRAILEMVASDFVFLLADEGQVAQASTDKRLVSARLTKGAHEASIQGIEINAALQISYLTFQEKVTWAHHPGKSMLDRKTRPCLEMPGSFVKHRANDAFTWLKDADVES